MNIIERSLALVSLIVISPLLFFLFFVVKIDTRGPFLFKQKRAGINKKPFTIYKIRTMINNADKLKAKYMKLNEANGPVFKIKNDPRHTSVGKLLSKYAIDETPQFINVVLGDMSLVGPRPLPLNEANKIPKKYNIRFSVLPGMTSPWVVNGSHKLSFKQWMDLDKDYIKKKSLWYDTKILIQTLWLILKAVKQ